MNNGAVPMEQPAQAAQRSAVDGDVPLFETLNKVGVNKPNEQQLFFEYAKPYGQFDAERNDFMLPRPMAQALMRKASQDRNFNNMIDAMRVQNMQMGLHQVGMAMQNPEVASQMKPEEQQFIAEYADKLNQQKQQIAKRTYYSHMIATGRLSPEQAESEYSGNAAREPLDGTQGVYPSKDQESQAGDITMGGLL